MKPIASLVMLSLLATAACVPRPRPTPPVPTPSAPPRPPAPIGVPAPTNWMDAVQTPGDWRYVAAEAGGRAIFASNGAAVFEMVCDRASRTITMIRPSIGSASGLITVRSETQVRALPAEIRGPALATRVPATDRLLDAMALSKGRFAIEVTGAPALYLPSWAEVTRVIEDCR